MFPDAEKHLSRSLQSHHRGERLYSKLNEELGWIKWSDTALYYKIIEQTYIQSIQYIHCIQNTPYINKYINTKSFLINSPWTK